MGAKVAIVMGSQSDWETMTCAAEVLDELGVESDVRIVSAHRTPDRMYDFAKGAADAGFEVIIAGAGGAAHEGVRRAWGVGWRWPHRCGCPACARAAGLRAARIASGLA